MPGKYRNGRKGLHMEPTLEMYKEQVEKALAAHPLLKEDVDDKAARVPAEGMIPQPLQSAMRYSVLLPGKRLRPVLLLAAYHLLLEDWPRVMPYALAVEMIHAYSLVHDDLPALDNDDLRRGKPTNHKVFGENIAILAGDGLYSLAMETMLDASLSAPNPAIAIRAMEVIARRAGVRGMIAGQTLDVKLEGTAPDETLVRYIHQHKTADLITAPLIAGMLLAGGDVAQVQAVTAYGQGLGMAFQIVDDLLDLQGDVQTLGKQTGMDAQRGKMTWPAVHGESQAREDASKYVMQAVDALNCFGERAAFLQTLAKQTLERVF